MSALGGMLELEYRHAAAGERHALRLHVALFDPTPVTTDYGTNDRLYVPGGPVEPTEASVLATFSAVAALWSPYYSPNWELRVASLRHLVSTNLVALSPVPTASPVSGSDESDDDSGPRGRRRIRLLGHAASVRHLWLSQVAMPVEPVSDLEVTPTSGGLDARDQAWVAYLSGASGGGAVQPDGTYCFEVTTMRAEWARPIELFAVEAGMPGSPYIVTG